MQDVDTQEHFKIIRDAFPRVAEGLSIRWGQKDFPEYAAQLISDSKYDRRGFPFNVLTSIMELKEAHDQFFPQFVKADEDIWSSSFFNTR